VPFAVVVAVAFAAGLVLALALVAALVVLVAVTASLGAVHAGQGGTSKHGTAKGIVSRRRAFESSRNHQRLSVLRRGV
jgi:hypothetical protein